MSKLYERLRDDINWVMVITVSVVSIMLSKGKFVALFQHNLVIGIFSIILLLTTIALFFLYLSAVRHELDLLESSFNSDKTKGITGYAFPIGIALGAFFGFLIAYSTNILIYAALAAGYSTVDLIGQSNVIRNVNIFIREGIFRPPTGKKEADILFDYYIKRPLSTKISLTLVSFSAAFVLAGFSRLEGQKYLEYIAYGLVVLTIVIGERAIFIWRRARDRRLAVLKTGNREKGSRLAL